MSQEDTGVQQVELTPEAQVRTGRGFSIIWVVPVIALLIGGWLAYKAITEKGPEITITFAGADGLEAGKTVIKFKDVEIGKVKTITLLKDLSGVEVTAEMRRDSEAYMTDRTQFWVVRARVAAGEISGLGTLFSGAYIGCNPSPEGLSKRSFTGLEKPPVLTGGLPGGHFMLQSDTLGSLDIGSPVFYRGIRVGQVVEYDFDKRAESILLKVFINAPFHEKVRENTRFWNASGVDLSLTSTGIKLDTQSLVSVLLGGIAFDLPQHVPPAKPAGDQKKFLLYVNYESSKEEIYGIKNYYLMYFDQSVRGLVPGAPVEIKGIKIGEVVDIQLMYDMSKVDFRIPVLVIIEPERINALIMEEGYIVKGKKMGEQLDQQRIKGKQGMMQPRLLIEKGLRAQLKTGNLLTGQLYIDLDFHPDAPPAKLIEESGYAVFPTIPEPFERIMQRVENILKQFEQVKVGKLSSELGAVVQELQGLLKELRSAAGIVSKETLPKINKEMLPKLNTSLDELTKTLEGIDTTLGPDSALNYNIRKLPEEISMTIRSLRSLLDYLERDPQALILGKKKEQEKEKEKK
jgi:paraquat-inducible protein B